MWYKKAQTVAKDFPQIKSLVHELPNGLENYAVEMMGNMTTPSYAQGNITEYIKKIAPFPVDKFRLPEIHEHCHCELVEVGSVPGTNEKIYFWRTDPAACSTCLSMAQVYNQASMDYLEDIYPKQQDTQVPVAQPEPQEEETQETQPQEEENVESEPTEAIESIQPEQPQVAQAPVQPMPAQQAPPQPQPQVQQQTPAQQPEPIVPNEPDELLNKILEPQNVQQNNYIVRKLRTRPFKSFV